MSNLLLRLKRSLPDQHFARSAALLVGGTTLGQALTVLVSPVLTRLYTPQDFGVLAIYGSILVMLVAVASLRYELAIPLPEDDERAANLVVLSLGIVLIISALVAGGGWLWGDQLAAWGNIPALKPYRWLLPLGLAGAGAYQVLNYWAVRKKAFGRIARTKLSQSAGQVLVQLALGQLNLGALGLLAGDLVGRVGGSGTLAVLIWRTDQEVIRRVSFAGIRQAARLYRRFPLISSGSALLNSAGLQAPALLIAALYGPQIAGWFALSQRVLGAPLALVGTAIGQVYLGTAARLVGEDPARASRLFSRTARQLFMIGLLPIGSLAIVGPWAFERVFGADWRAAGEYVQLMTPMIVLQFVVSPLSQTAAMINRQEIQLVWDIARVAIVVLVFALASLLNIGPKAAIGIYSVSMFIAYGWLFHLYWRGLRHLSAGAESK